MATTSPQHHNDVIESNGNVKFNVPNELDADNTWPSCPGSCTNVDNVVEPQPIATNGQSLHHVSASAPNLDVPGLTRETSSTSLSNEPNRQVIDGIVIVRKDDIAPNAPLIVLTGWAGCADKNLAKYSNFYVEQGYMVARQTVPIGQVLSFGTYQRFALKLYEHVFQHEDTAGRPVFVHNFSMNGCSLFAMFWRLLGSLSDGQDIKDRVKGLIFDSSPANVMPWHIAEAISLGHKNTVVRHTVKMIMLASLSIHRAGVWATSKVYPTIYDNQFAFYMLLSFDDFPKHQLYLYSECDTICLPSSIRDFQAAQKQHGVTVEEICWQVSGHCRHLVPHKDEYINKCVGFVQQYSKHSNNNQANV